MAFQLALGCRYGYGIYGYGYSHRRCCNNVDLYNCFQCALPESLVIAGSSIPDYPNDNDCWEVVDGTWDFDSFGYLPPYVIGNPSAPCNRTRFLFDGRTNDCRDPDNPTFGPLEPYIGASIVLLRKDVIATHVIEVRIGYVMRGGLYSSTHVYQVHEDDMPERCFEGEVEIPFIATETVPSFIDILQSTPPTAIKLIFPVP